MLVFLFLGKKADRLTHFDRNSNHDFRSCDKLFTYIYIYILQT